MYSFIGFTNFDKTPLKPMPNNQAPFFKFLFPFVLGIATNIYLDIAPPFFLLVIIFSAFVVCLVLSQYAKIHWNFRWIFGLITFLFFLVSGALITKQGQSVSCIENNTKISAIIRLVDIPEIRTTSTRVAAEISMVQVDNEWKQVNEKTLLYFSTSDSLSKNLTYGDIIAIKAQFKSPPGEQNPYQFNYKAYLEKKDIHRVAFVSSANWFRVGNKQKRAYALSLKLRNSLMHLYTKVGIEGENLAVLTALTMGYKNLLDQETRKAFTASGAMHILAVSGLHVGVLFATLSLLLFFLNSSSRGRIIKALILIVFLWFYAYFTGLSPSVVRASLMFSLVTLGTAFSRKTNIYNTLSASAFVILALNPMLITEVGFQLSYSAVLSIVFFYPHIYKVIYVKNRLLNSVWQLLAVSLAAQLGTFALGLFYFNQFSNLFLFTNLYAIPLATVAIYASVALLLLGSFIPFLGVFFGWVLNHTLSALSYLVHFTENIPYSTSEGVFISATQAIVLTLALLMLALLLQHRKVQYLFIMLACFLILFIEQSVRYIIQNEESEMVVFADSHKSILGFRNGLNLTLFTTDTLNCSASDFNFTLGGYLNRVGAENDIAIQSFSELQSINENKVCALTQNQVGLWLHFDGRLIAIPNHKTVNRYSAQKPMRVDMVLVNKESATNFSKIASIFNSDIFVIDQTVAQWQVARIKELASEMHLNCYFIADNGAFVL